MYAWHINIMIISLVGLHKSPPLMGRLGIIPNIFEWCNLAVNFYKDFRKKIIVYFL